jgi:hypothetical protein
MPNLIAYPELSDLNSESISVINNYHGLFKNHEQKKFIIYSCFGEVLLLPDLISILEQCKNQTFILITARDYPAELTDQYNFKMIKVSSAYAWYSTQIPRTKINFERSFERIMLSLNNRAQWNRQALFQFLSKFNLIKDCYFSYHCHDRFNVGQKTIYDQTNHVIGNTWFNSDLDFDKLFEQIPVTTAMDNFANNDWSCGNSYYYNNSFCSFVNETYIDENHNAFFTEKTMNPLAFGHPMLLFSSAGALQLLRSFGFETYAEIFNEDYDLIESPHLRFESMLQETLRLFQCTPNELMSMYHKIKPKLEYNYNYFWNDWYQQYTVEINHARTQLIDWCS